MINQSIISEGEALRILKSELRRAALQKHAAELNDANPEQKAEILRQIDLEIQKELRKRASRTPRGILLH